MPATEIYKLHPLFEDVQLGRIFPDGKTFVDCIPRFAPEQILKDYETARHQPGFNLKRFVLSQFMLPEAKTQQYKSDTAKGVVKHIENLWPVLTRQPGGEEGSLLPLPYPYIVPGGRFGEIYYWDSYFTMLGLKASGYFSMIGNMVGNFSYLIQKFGYIPNGNRSYFLGRSQPPFYSLMVELLDSVKEDDELLAHLPFLEKEYAFWMREDSDSTSTRRVLRLPDGSLLNRYWDEHDSPRPEAYAADTSLAKRSQQESSHLYRNLRAGAESGWDFSSRWFRDAGSFPSIHCTDIAPVDLNGLIYNLEKLIALCHERAGNMEESTRYRSWAEKRKQTLNHYCWNPDKGFYFDYDSVAGQQKKAWTIAGASPLFFKMASSEQAAAVAKNINEKFLCPGGVVTSLHQSGQQWDAPNGWAPLQWMAIEGLENYGFHELAAAIAQRWIRLNTEVFERTGKLMEKYNVVDPHLEAGGGEYEGQDGFGWTNGVLLALMNKENFVGKSSFRML
jgi:alpha,alpha-trehalase